MKKFQEVVPLYRDPNTNTNATQFSMKYVEKSGLIKFDFLGLTTLSIIADSIKFINKNKLNFSINNIPLDDLKTYEQLSRGETVGIFQLESNGMGSVLRQLQPDRFEEIIAVVALFRPGPMDNIPSFCNRKHGKKNSIYTFYVRKCFRRNLWNNCIPRASNANSTSTVKLFIRRSRSSKKSYGQKNTKRNGYAKIKVY